MNILSKKRNYQQSLKQISVMMELEKSVNADTIFGHSIKLALLEKQPYPIIAGEIKDQLKDNRKAVLNCIPANIIADIEKYF